MNKIKTGDSVIVIAGKDKGKQGSITKILTNGRCYVSGVQMVKRHTKANPQAGIAGGLVEKEASINVSNISIFNPSSKKADKVSIKTLEDGMHTKVGERGVQLSGGQRQRVGIARALYHDAEVLVFDEATSSLDGITEKMIMEAIHEFSRKKTIILIAHRLKTVQKCDKIFFIDNGKVADQGTYDELMDKNEQFKKMSMHA